MKKLVPVTLCVVLVGLMFTGCSKAGNSDKAGSAAQTANTAPANFNATGYPVVNSKITLKMFGMKTPNQAPWDQMDFFQTMEKLTNIHYEFDVPSSTTAQEKKNLAFASGELPDVFFGSLLKPNDEITYGSQGSLIPLENLIDKYAPNLKAVFAKDPNIKKGITTPDGHIYALPMLITLPRDLTNKLWINTEWLKNVGMKMPATTDDLYEVLKAFKEKDPNRNGKADEIPLASSTLFSDRFGAGVGLLSAFGIAAHPQSFGGGRVEAGDNGKVLYIPVQPQYEQFLKYMNKLYAEKLLDNEMFSQTPQQFNAKGQQRKYGVLPEAGAFLTVPAEDNEKFSALPPLTSPVNSTKMWPKRVNFLRGTFAITKVNKYPEATIRWVDYLYSKDGSLLSNGGSEGNGWAWVDAAKTTTKNLLPEGANPGQFRGKLTPAAGIGIPKNNPDYFGLKSAPDPLNDWVDQNVVKTYVPYWKDPFPQTYFNIDEQKKVSALETDINSYVDQMDAKFITGAESFDKWDDYVSTLNKMGANDLVKLYQAAYDRWKNVK